MSLGEAYDGDDISLGVKASFLSVFRCLLHTMVGGLVSLARVEQPEGVPLVGEGFPVIQNPILDHKKEYQIESV